MQFSAASPPALHDDGGAKIEQHPNKVRRRTTPHLSRLTHAHIRRAQLHQHLVLDPK